MVFPAPGEPWTMKMPPRRRPPRRTVSSPDTPVGMRWSVGRLGSSVRIFCAARGKRESHRERRSGTRVAENADLALHGAHQLTRDPQADAKPSIGLHPTRATKALEDQRLLAIRYSDPSVSHRELGNLAIARKRDLDGLPGSEANGVGKQVLQDLLDRH